MVNLWGTPLLWLVTKSIFKLLLGAALLTTLTACQGEKAKQESQMSSAEMMDGHGDEMMDGHGDPGSMAMGDALFTGTFQRGEAPGAGSVTIVKHGDQTVLHLSEDFASDPKAPDLYVVVGNRANPIEGKPHPYPLVDDEYQTVDVLKSVAGAQSYQLPDDIELSEDSSVIIWCKQFNATMHYAPLQPAPMG